MALRFGVSPSKLMIPLSYAAVLGGMTTLIGSSTNLLVNGALIEAGQRPFGFFDFSLPGIVMAAAGLVYVLLIAPRLLPERLFFALINVALGLLCLKLLAEVGAAWL